MDVLIVMTSILGTMLSLLGGLIAIQTPSSSSTSTSSTDQRMISPTSTFLPNPKIQPSKYAYEVYGTYYSIVWMSCFGIIILSSAYESFTATSYNILCLGLALPFILQPILLPSATLFSSSSSFQNPDIYRPWYRRYSTKANVWIGIYSFIGNYWYTHYFYSILGASFQSMPQTPLNNVPLSNYLATHFYFSSYHILSNVILRKIITTYEQSILRFCLLLWTIGCLAYITAFMETLTISSFPYYTFEDRDMAYVIGSAFYGIYFIVSFPAFFFFDNAIDITTITDNNNNNKKEENDDNDKKKEKAEADMSSRSNMAEVTLWDTVVSSCGYGMMILLLLDFVRLFLKIPLVVELSPSP